MNDLELRPEVRVIDADTVEVRSTSRPWLVYRMVRLPDGWMHSAVGCEDEQFRGPLSCRHTRRSENATMSENGQTALTVRQQAVAPVGLNFTPQQMTVFKDQICKGASEAEIQMAMAICYRTGLDPFLKQIHFVMRWDGKLKREVMVPVIGMDGFRLLSERSGHYAGMDAIEWLDEDGCWSEVWTGKGPYPIAARCTVYRTDSPRPVVAVCKWDSYVQTNSDGKPNASWSRMPDVMIGNAAERLARRRAYPAETAGVTVDEEMDAPPPNVVEGVIEGTVVEPQPRKPTGIDVRDAIAATKDRPDHYQLLEDFKVAYPDSVSHPDEKFYPQRIKTPQLEEALEWIALWLRAHEPAPAADTETTAAQAPLV